MTFQPPDLQSSFQNSMTSDPSLWSESLYTGPSPWSSCGSKTPGQDSGLGGSGFVHVAGSDETTTNPTQTFDTSNIYFDNIDYVPLMETTAGETTTSETTTSETTAGPSLSPSLSGLEVPVSADDPFMGWASKRASHNFDDYGWVLSHVENL
jgi:hypothetical protein